MSQTLADRIRADQYSGISPANDTIYYQFLLKLQVIRAGTWGEKWDLWRATHSISIDSTAYSPKDIIRGLEDVRSKVPFLAGASSDLDDAFGETSYSADESQYEYTSPVKLLRPSPRKASGTFRRSNRVEQGDESRSLVGYTPDQSFDLSPLDLDLPARTSTPIYAQARRGLPTTTPPPYSVSISEDAQSFGYEQTEEGILIEGLSTPKARTRALDEERILEDEVIREMERRADQFYETGLVGRCFDVWAQAHDWVQVS